MPPNELTVLLKFKDLATKQVQKAQGAVKKFAAGINNLAKKLVSLRSIITIGAIVALGRNFIGAAASVEVFGKQLEIVTKDAKEAAIALEAIREFARTSPLETEDVTQAYVRMRAVGINPTMKQMRTIGGVAVLMNRQMTDVLQAFIGMNKRTLRELGVDIDRTGAKAVIQSGNIRKVVEKDSQSIRTALLEIWEERFPNAIEQAAGTTKAKVAIMKSEIFELSASIGEKLKPAFDSVTIAIGKMAGALRKVIDPTNKEKVVKLREELVELNKQLNVGFKGSGGSGMFGDLSPTTGAKQAAVEEKIAKKRLEILKLTLEIQKKRREFDNIGTGELGTGGVDGGGSAENAAMKRHKAFAEESKRLMKEEQERREQEVKNVEDKWNRIGQANLLRIETEKALTAEAKAEAEKRMAIAEQEYRMKQAIVSGVGRLTQQSISLIGALTQAEGESARRLQIISAGVALVEGTVAGAMAIKTAWSSSSTWQEGLAASLAVAAEVTALTASLVSTINSQSFAQGGVVSGNNMTGDRVTAQVNSGEMVLNRNQQSELFRIANGGGATNNTNMGGVTFVLQGDQVNDLQNALRDGRLSDFVVDFSRAQRSMAV